MPNVSQGQFEDFDAIASPGISAALKGRWYFDTDNRFKFSENAGAFRFLTGQVAAVLASGQALFASSAGLATQDSDFVWDNTAKRLGLGVSAPLARAHLVQAVGSSGTPLPGLRVDGGAHTTLTASETIDVDFRLNRTVQFTTGGAIASQRAVVLRPPTYSATAATQTITEAATFAILGEPVAGTNVAITGGFAVTIDGRTDFFADKPTGSAASYVGFAHGVELGGGTQSAQMVGITSSFRTLAASIVSGGTTLCSGVSAVALHGSTGTATNLAGIAGFFAMTGAAIALGTVTDGSGVYGQVLYDSDGGLPTSGTVTGAQCFLADSPANTSALRTISTLRGLRVKNQGATGITTAIGVDVEAQSGATNNFGIRTASVLQITGGGIDHDAGNLGFFGAAQAAQQVSAVNLTNNVTAGGTSDTIDDFAVSVAIDTVNAASQPDVNARLASIRNDIHQLARKLKQVNDGLRAYGLLT